MRCAAAALPLVLLTSLLHAQQLIVHDKPEHLRHLAGSVVDPKGFAIPYAVIELHDPKDHHLIASTFADGNGRFLFADRKHGETLELRVARAGFNSSQYTIVVTRIGKEHMRAVLTIAA